MNPMPYTSEETLFEKKFWRFFCINSPLPTTSTPHSEKREAKAPFCLNSHLANPKVEANYRSIHQKPSAFEKEWKDKKESCVVVTSTPKSIEVIR